MEKLCYVKLILSLFTCSENVDNGKDQACKVDAQKQTAISNMNMLTKVFFDVQ